MEKDEWFSPDPPQRPRRHCSFGACKVCLSIYNPEEVCALHKKNVVPTQNKPLRTYGPIVPFAVTARVPTPNQLISLVCEEYGVKYATLVARARTKGNLRIPRLVAMYLLCRDARMTHRSTAELIGGKSPTATHVAVGKIQQMIKARSLKICEAINRIRTRYTQFS